MGFLATCQIMLFKCIYWHLRRLFLILSNVYVLSPSHTHVSGKCFSTSKNQNSDLWMSTWKISFFRNDWACINYIWMQFYPCYQFEKAQPGSTTCTDMWLKCHYWFDLWKERISCADKDPLGLVSSFSRCLAWDWKKHHFQVGCV